MWGKCKNLGNLIIFLFSLSFIEPFVFELQVLIYNLGMAFMFMFMAQGGARDQKLGHLYDALFYF